MVRGRGRGRGRGAFRGRGGAVGRGYGGHLPGGRQSKESDKDTAPVDLSVDGDVKQYFLTIATFDQHYRAQNTNKERYCAALTTLVKSRVDFAKNAKVRALAAAWARHDNELANAFLESPNFISPSDVFKAVKLLDSGRSIREIEKKLRMLNLQASKPKPHVIGKVKSNIDNLNANKPMAGSASGALARHIRRWARKLTVEELEFFALRFPTEPWRKLADICHFNPKKDFAADWFLPFCFGADPPIDSMVESCRSLNADNINDLIHDFNIPYSHLKPHLLYISNQSKAKIAQYEKLDTVIWYFEELRCPEVDAVICRRIEAGEEVTLSYGKMMERMMTMRKQARCRSMQMLMPIAEASLESITLPLDSPVAVFGDASASMQVAIRTATIIASLLTAICDAQLRFFQNIDRADFLGSRDPPKTVTEVFDFIDTVQAGRSTAPAACLWHFFEKKEVIKTFIIVTDEEENTMSNGYYFAQLFRLYREQVYPAQLVFVSFLRGQHDRGDMMKKLEKQNIDEDVVQFKFSRDRPDLNKLDNLLGRLSSGTSSFDEEVRLMEREINENGLAKMLRLSCKSDGV